MQDLILSISSLSRGNVSAGRDEMQNVEACHEGAPYTFDFLMKSHVDLGATLRLDFDTGAKPLGARFTVPKG